MSDQYLDEVLELSEEEFSRLVAALKLRYKYFKPKFDFVSISLPESNEIPWWLTDETNP